MEVYFLDVGQGTCNVILIGQRRAIVIDTGRRASDLRLLLNKFQIDTITCLALSHLDADHSGGASEILREFRGRIGKICYPNDHRVMQTTFWIKLQTELRGSHIKTDQLVRLECTNGPKEIWRSNATKAELKLFSPTFGENQLAMQAKDPNATSGVLVLKVGDKRIVFPGDSSLEQWREIRVRRGTALPCEVIAIPHHAGIIWPGHLANAQVRTELEWLYKEAVRPSHAVISVGTSNIDSHPRPEVISILRKLGTKVLCTQITDQCCTNLEPVRPGLIPLIDPGRSRPTTSLTRAKNSRDVACAGTIVVDIVPAAVGVRRLTQHQAAVSAAAKKENWFPLCR